MTAIERVIAFVTSQDGWILQVFIIISCVLLLDFFQRRVLRKLIQHAEEKTKNIWDDALLHSSRRPITLVLWMLGLTMISQLVHRAQDQQLADIIAIISHVGIIIALTWFASDFIFVAQKKLIGEQQSKIGGEESRIDSVTIEALCKLLRLAVLITAGIVILDTLGFSISGVLAFGGIGGIAIGNGLSMYRMRCFLPSLLKIPRECLIVVFMKRWGCAIVMLPKWKPLLVI